MKKSELNGYLLDDSKEWKDQVHFLTSTQKKGRRYILNNKKFFQWQFHNPLWKERRASFLRYRSKKEIISEIGFFPILSISGLFPSIGVRVPEPFSLKGERGRRISLWYLGIIKMPLLWSADLAGARCRIYGAL
jgi:hypothetical protein